MLTPHERSPRRRGVSAGATAMRLGNPKWQGMQNTHTVSQKSSRNELFPGPTPVMEVARAHSLTAMNCKRSRVCL